MTEVRLCAGCGEPLVGKRRGAEAHNATCRSRKKRRLERERRMSLDGFGKGLGFASTNFRHVDTAALLAALDLSAKQQRKLCQRLVALTKT